MIAVAGHLDSNGTDFACYKSRECMTVVPGCQFAGPGISVARIRSTDCVLLD